MVHKSICQPPPPSSRVLAHQTSEPTAWKGWNAHLEVGNELLLKWRSFVYFEVWVKEGVESENATKFSTELILLTKGNIIYKPLVIIWL